MECNSLMERLLTKIYKKGVSPFYNYHIWKKNTLDGNVFWGIGNFCGLDTEEIIKYGKELTDLEWQGNELFFSNTERELLEEEIVAAYLALKKQMEEEFPDTIFDLVVSVERESNTGTIRFYEVRDGYHYIDPTHKNLTGFLQEAILVETVNAIHLEAYIPLLTKRLKGYPVEVHFTKEKEIQIKNRFNEEELYIIWDEEFTMYFGNYHGHYGEERWEELLEDIEGILSGRFVTGRIESSGRWLGSILYTCEEIPVTSKDKLLKFLFGNQNDFYKEVQRNGGVFSIIAWNSKKNQSYLITENGIERTM